MAHVQLPYVNVFKHFGVDAEKNALRSFAAPPGSHPRIRARRDASSMLIYGRTVCLACLGYGSVRLPYLYPGLSPSQREGKEGRRGSGSSIPRIICECTLKDMCFREGAVQPVMDKIIGKRVFRIVGEFVLTVRAPRNHRAGGVQWIVYV